jgi:hypothetical protein
MYQGLSFSRVLQIIHIYKQMRKSKIDIKNVEGFMYCKRLYGNSVIFNKAELSEEETYLLRMIRSLKETEKYFVMTSFKNIWPQLEENLTDELTNKLKDISTSFKKCYFSLSGMEEINIPPYGTIYNPRPDWISVFFKGIDCFLRAQTYDYDAYQEHFAKFSFPLDDYSPADWKLQELARGISDIVSFLSMAGMEAVLLSAVHQYDRQNYEPYKNALTVCTYIKNRDSSGMSRPHAFWAAIKKWEQSTLINFNDIAEKHCKKWKSDYQEKFGEQTLMELIAKIRQDHDLQQCPWPNVPRYLMQTFIKILETA